MARSSLSGQWIAHNDQLNPRVILDLDPTRNGARGTCYVYSQLQNSPSGFFNLSISNRKRKAPYIVQIRPFDAMLCRELTNADVKRYFPDTNFPTQAELSVERVGSNQLKIDYQASSEPAGNIMLERVSIPKTSNLDADHRVYSWQTFKAVIESYDFGDFAFRGQAKPYPLQTSFHRTGRKDLQKFLNEDIKALHRSLTGVTGHVFNLDIPQELGAFLSLAQHHGFPTPLLDWTYSPFIAAWFAFSNIRTISRRNQDRDSIRIYCLNKRALADLFQINHITLGIPHTSLLEALPIENNRAIPQQGILMLTNLQDIEAHLFNLEQSTKNQLLTAFDIPFRDASQALADLAKMGITRSTLMPGIESICLDQKMRRYP